MKEFRTMRYHYKTTNKEKKLLKFLCRISKNIYNCALYDLRGQYFDNKRMSRGLTNLSRVIVALFRKNTHSVK